jgi:hypothetical protein
MMWTSPQNTYFLVLFVYYVADCAQQLHFSLQICKLKEDIEKLQASEAENKALSFNYAAMLKEKEVCMVGRSPPPLTRIAYLLARIRALFLYALFCDGKLMHRASLAA